MARTTLRLSAYPFDSADTAASIRQAAEILQQGGTVAFPTETVYGLGANALSSAAVEKIFLAKHRPGWDPLIVHIADAAMLDEVAVSIPEPARLWMDRFWPGPLTLLLPRSRRVPDAVTAGRQLVGVRMPRHPVAQALLRVAGIPVAAPSANLFGHVSPTTAEHVLADLDGRIDAVLDGGATEHGVESTVVDAFSSPCRIYRPGAVTVQQLRESWAAVELFQAAEAATAAEPQALPSPGVGLRHYAPRAKLILIEPGPGQGERLLARVADKRCEQAGILLPQGFLSEPQRQRLSATADVFAWGSWASAEEMARLLYAGLRHLDERGVACILCPVPDEEGLGLALCDRLRKAARSA